MLFDLDGVLLDTEPLHGKAWSRTCRSFDTSLNENQLKLLQGRRRKDCAQQIANWIKNPVPIEEILKVHAPISKELLKQAKAMPGAKRLVSWCAKNKFPIALVTSSASNSVNAKTTPHPWLDCFSTRVQGDDPSLLKGKPYPDPYLLGAEKLKTDPNKCWAIEDSISGTKSALSAGCQVWVLRNDSNKKIESFETKESNLNPIYVDHLNDILETLIKTMN